MGNDSISENPHKMDTPPQPRGPDFRGTTEQQKKNAAETPARQGLERESVIKNAHDSESMIAANVSKSRPETQLLQPPSLSNTQKPIAPSENTALRRSIEEQEDKSQESNVDENDLKKQAKEVLEASKQGASKGLDTAAEATTGALSKAMEWISGIYTSLIKPVWEKITQAFRKMSQGTKKNLATMLTFMGMKEWGDRLLALPAGVTEKDQKELAGIRARIKPGKIKEEGDPAKDAEALEKLRANHAALLRQYPGLRSRYPEGTEGGFLGYVDDVVRQNLQPENGKEYTLAQVIEVTDTFNEDAAVRNAEATKEEQVPETAATTPAPAPEAPPATVPPAPTAPATPPPAA